MASDCVLVPLGGRPRPELCRDLDDNHYQYTLFIRLMNILAVERTGFWMNRRNLLHEASNTSVLLSPDKRDILAFHVISPDGEIKFFQVFDQRKGIGRMLVERARLAHREELVVRDVMPDAILFWQRVGVRIATNNKY